MQIFHLNNKQRDMYAEKLIDLAHLIFGGGILGQFLWDKPFSPELAFGGIIAVAYLYYLSYTFTRTKKRRKK